MTMFLGSFAAITVFLLIGYYVVRHKIKRLSGQIFQNQNLLEALAEIDDEALTHPRSLSGCDTLLLPKIQKDFPDFDITLAKTYAKDHISKKLGHHDNFTIHNVVISQYLPTAIQKTIVFQAAVAWTENETIQQKRYTLHYTYLLEHTDSIVAANCPNCGGALQFGITECPYCESRIANVMGNTWRFTALEES